MKGKIYVEIFHINNNRYKVTYEFIESKLNNFTSITRIVEQLKSGKKLIEQFPIPLMKTIPLLDWCKNTMNLNMTYIKEFFKEK